MEQNEYFTIMVVDSKWNKFIVGLQNGSRKNFELIDIAKLFHTFPQQGDMDDKQYKAVIDSCLAAFVKDLAFYEPKLTYRYTKTGELSFKDYTLARLCIRGLYKMLEDN